MADSITPTTAGTQPKPIRTDSARLKKTLGGPEFAWILNRLRKKLERGEPCRGVVHLAQASREERKALDDLFGRKPSLGGTLSVDLERLEELLRHAGMVESLPEAVEILTGPWRNRLLEKKEQESSWERFFETVSVWPFWPVWMKELKSTGLLKRLSQGDITEANRLLDRSLRVLQSLPQSGCYLSELAAKVTGNSHALDFGTPLSTLVLKALSISATDNLSAENLPKNKLKADLIHPSETPADQRRNLWAEFGVVTDEVSAPVLVLNLRADPTSFTGKILEQFADLGEPCRLTLRQLLRYPPEFSPSITGDKIYVCENPSVLAAVADRLGPKSAPLICLEGKPKTTAHVLLRLICGQGIGIGKREREKKPGQQQEHHPGLNSGIQLFYHGDFDWDGIQIGNQIIQTYSAKPWRYSAEDYRKQFESGESFESFEFGEPFESFEIGTAPDQKWKSEHSPISELSGSPQPASWDATLMPTMQSVGRWVHEEAVLDLLVDDLRIPD